MLGRCRSEGPRPACPGSAAGGTGVAPVAHHAVLPAANSTAATAAAISGKEDRLLFQTLGDLVLVWLMFGFSGVSHSGAIRFPLGPPGMTAPARPQKQDTASKLGSQFTWECTRLAGAQGRLGRSEGQQHRPWSPAATCAHVSAHPSESRSILPSLPVVTPYLTGRNGTYPPAKLICPFLFFYC
jgi:hypothetical protein